MSVFSDWLHLLDGPRHEAFAQIVEKENWTRLFKLLGLVLFLSGAIVGARLTIESFQNLPKVLESQLALTFLIVGAMLAVLYNGIARLFGITLTLPKAFFIILSLGLPWVPISACIDVIPVLPGFKLQGIIFLLSHLVLIKPIFNFIAGVKSVTGCAGWRVAVSILLPITFFLFVVIYMFS